MRILAVGGLRCSARPPRYELEANQAGGEQVEAGEDVQAALVADGEAPEPAEPGRVRSKIHRCRPSFSLLSIPRRAILGTIWRQRSDQYRIR